jgi:hypothetical protein
MMISAMPRTWKSIEKGNVLNTASYPIFSANLPSFLQSIEDYHYRLDPSRIPNRF